MPADATSTVTFSARTADKSAVRVAVLTFVLALSAVTALFAEGVRIIPLVRDDAVLVSFELTDGYTPEVKDAVHSGLKTTFTYTVELRQDVPAWVDRTIATSVITNSVQYDNLTRRATLTRTLDGHVDSVETTEEESVIKQWMTTFQKMPLFKTGELEQNREYYVRVRDSAAHQRIDALAVGQRYLRDDEVHVPSLTHQPLPVTNQPGNLVD
jgi:hypothetical protein